MAVGSLREARSTRSASTNKYYYSEEGEESSRNHRRRRRRRREESVESSERRERKKKGARKGSLDEKRKTPNLSTSMVSVRTNESARDGVTNCGGSLLNDARVHAKTSPTKLVQQQNSVIGSTAIDCCGDSEELEDVVPIEYAVEHFQSGLRDAILSNELNRFVRLLDKFNSRIGAKQDTLESSTLRQMEQHHSGSKRNISRKGETNGYSSAGSVSLLDSVIDTNRKTTIMHLVVQSGREDFVERCLYFGTAVHSFEDVEGATPLSLALCLHPHLVHDMFALGKDVDAERVNMYGQNLLHFAVAVRADTPEWSQRCNFVEDLLSRYPTMVEAVDVFGCTPLMLAEKLKKYYHSEYEYLTIINCIGHAQHLIGVRCTEPHSPLSEPIFSPKGERVAVRYIDTVDNEGRDEENPPTTQAPTAVRRYTFYMFIRCPYVRLLTIFALLLLHIFSYALQLAHARRERPTWAQWNFFFTVYNNVFSGWRSGALYMGMMHCLCCFATGILAAFAFFYVVHWLLCVKVLKLQAFGARSDEEHTFLVSSFGPTYPVFYKACERGMFFSLFVGALLGVYGGAKLYNISVEYIWPSHRSWALIEPIVEGLNTVNALYIFSICTFIIDWFVFMFVFDVMYQQSTLSIYLPHPSFVSFAALINKGESLSGKEVLQNIFHCRMKFFWIGLLGGWLILAAIWCVMVFTTGWYREQLEKWLVNTLWSGAPVVLSSCAIALECIIVCQEWTWPTLQLHPYLFIPGMPISSHHAWFLVATLLVEICLDFRPIQQYMGALTQLDPPVSRSSWGFALSLIPAVLGLVFLVCFILASSLWWLRCGECGRHIALDSKHMFTHYKMPEKRRKRRG